jgi:hypothetical protein
MRNLILIAALTTATCVTHTTANAETFTVPEGYTCTIEQRPVIRRDRTAPGTDALPPGYRIEPRSVPRCKRTPRKAANA